jgi:hypothetical protein
MVRKILAGLAGIVVANILVFGFQMLSGLIFGVPKNLDPNDMEAMKAYIAGLPASAFLFVAASYAVAYFVAGFVMAKIAKWDSLVLPLVLGVLGTLGWILNISYLPHPVWMIVLGFFCFIPFALIGYRVGK